MRRTNLVSRFMGERKKFIRIVEGFLLASLVFDGHSLANHIIQGRLP